MESKITKFVGGARWPIAPKFWLTLPLMLLTSNLMASLHTRLRYRYRRATYASARPERTDFSIAIPLRSTDLPRPPLHIAVVIHLFHIDLAEDFRERIERADITANLLISTDTKEKREAIIRAFSGFESGTVDVAVTPNRGRDIHAKLAFARKYLEYDLVLFLHSKHSTHFAFGEKWRLHLLDHLLGTPEVVDSILALFAASPDLGIVFPQHFEAVRPYVCWGAGENFSLAAKIARKFRTALNPRVPIDFPSGSMFWCRPRALAPLIGLELNADDFPEELAQTDGTLAHAIERLMLVSAEIAGMQWLKVALPDHFVSRDTIVEIGSSKLVGAFLDEHGFSLTRPGR